MGPRGGNRNAAITKHAGDPAEMIGEGTRVVPHVVMTWNKRPGRSDIDAGWRAFVRPFVVELNFKLTRRQRSLHDDQAVARDGQGLSAEFGETWQHSATNADIALTQPAMSVGLRSALTGHGAGSPHSQNADSPHPLR